MKRPVALVAHTAKASARILLYGYDKNDFEHCAESLREDVTKVVFRDGRKTLAIIERSPSNEGDN